MKALLSMLWMAGLLYLPGLVRLSPASPAAHTYTPSAPEYLQGWAPGALGLAISPDGKTAYVPFELDDSLLVVDLPTLTPVDSIDLSSAGSMLGSSAALLTPDGVKLFISNYAARNVVAVNTQLRQIAAVLALDPLHAVALSASRDGSKVYVPTQDGGLYIVSTADLSYSKIFVPGVIFGPVMPSPADPDLLYSVGTLMPAENTFQPSFFSFRISTREKVSWASLSPAELPANLMARRLVVNAAGTRAYFGYQSAPTDRGAGNFTTFDLEHFRVLDTKPVENGVADFTLNEGAGRAYLIGLWAGGSAPGVLPVHEWDLATNAPVREIPLSPASDQRAVLLDPTDPDILYETEGDFNLLRRVDLVTGQETGRVQFNREQFKPYSLLRDGDTAYVVCQSYRRVFKLDLLTGQITGSFSLPFEFSGWGVYGGRLYMGRGNAVVAIDPSDGTVAGRYPLGWNLNGLVYTFFGDRMAAIDYQEGMLARQLVLFDARTMQPLKSVPLPLEPHGDKVIVSPDGSKLYLARGPMWGGTTTITVYAAETLNVLNTIEIPAENLRNGASSFVQGDFDEVNKIFYLAGFTSIYKIGMDSDALIGTLHLVDLYPSDQIRGWSPTGLAGLALSASRDKLFAVSGDAHSMYTYDLTRAAWDEKITNVRGYFVTDAIPTPDRRYLYTVNSRMDSLTRIDLASSGVDQLIDLHSYVHEIYLPALTR